MTPGDSGRLRVLSISPEIVIAMLTGRAVLHSYDIPEGAQVVDCGYDLNRRSFYVTLAHASFGAVPPGEFIPQLPATIQVARPERGA